MFRLKKHDMKNVQDQKVRVNITVDKEFYDLLQETAQKDYMLVGSWVRRYLKMNLLDNQCLGCKRE